MTKIDGGRLAARHRGDNTPNTEFLWRSQLDIARALAERGQLADALLERPWWRADSSLLHSLGARAFRPEPATARRLYRGAHVALLGEPELDEWRLLQLLEGERRLAAAAGDTSGQARATAALEWARRAGLEGGAAPALRTSR